MKAILISLSMFFFMGHQLVPHHHEEEEHVVSIHQHNHHHCWLSILHNAFSVDFGADHLQNYQTKKCQELHFVTPASFVLRPVLQLEGVYSFPYPIDHSTSLAGNFCLRGPPCKG